MIINGLLVLFIIGAIYNILFHQRGIQNSLGWIIAAFIFGYRTVEPVNGLKLHPIEIMVYASTLRILLFKTKRFLKMPHSVLILSAIFVLYFILDIVTRYNPIVLLEFKNGILLTGVFFVSLYINFTKSYLKSLLKVYLGATTLISIFGILEFVAPSIMSTLFGYSNTNEIIYNDMFFNRVAFLFWGSHLAANLIPPAFPILLFLKSEKDQITKNNYLLTIIIIINLFAVYLSGNRISWLILTIFLLMTLFIYKGKVLPFMKTYAIFVTIGFVIYVYSQPVEGRYISTFKALTGKIDHQYDSSGAARMGRIKIALNSIINHPIGTGWGSQGWVHSDVLQIGASLGIITGLILLFGPIILFKKLYSVFKNAHQKDQTAIFVCGGLLIYASVSFVLNGNILKVQTGAPLYVCWAIANAYYHSFINQYEPTKTIS